MSPFNNDKKLISFVIPTFERPDHLKLMLDELSPQLQLDGLLNQCEVVVSDDSKDTRTRDLMNRKFPLFRWIEGPKRGPASNRNFGCRNSIGKWTIFLDDDVLPSKSLLRAYLSEFERVESEDQLIAFVGPTERQRAPTSLLYEAPHNPHGTNMISCNMAISRRVFLKVGMFDERYPWAAFEDTEFEARFRAMGGDVICVKDASVIHPLRRRPKARRLALKWEGRIIYALDHGAPTAFLLWRLPVHVFCHVRSKFQNAELNVENRAALRASILEVVLVFLLTPIWVCKWRTKPRSRFWSREAVEGRGLQTFGF